VVSMSPLGMKETQAATQLPCLTAGELQSGALNGRLQETVSKRAGSPFAIVGSHEELLNT
jgi:hypothetical protein